MNVPSRQVFSRTFIKNEELCTVASDHAVITWVTPEQKTDTSIYFGEEKGNLTRFTLERAQEFHRAELNNLRPSTRYWYQVESNGARGALSSFQTLPAPQGKHLFSCALFSDTHLALGDSVGDPNEIYFGKLPEHSGELFSQCIRDSRRRGINLAVVTGDLTDAASQQQFKQARHKVLPAFGHVPYYLCIGNHDKYVEKSVRGLGEKGFLRYVAGRENTYTSVDYQGCRFLLLDSCVKDNDWGTIDEAQLRWLTGALGESSGRPVFVFLHHPCNGPDLWFGIDNARFTQLLKGFPNVQGVFSGHMHRSKVTTNRSRTGNLPYVELPATVQFPCAYAVVRVYEKGFEYNVYKVSRLDLVEKSREKVILKSLGSALYTWYAFGGIGDRNVSYFNGLLHRPVQYELSVTLDDSRAIALYVKAQSREGASLAPAAKGGELKVILGRFESRRAAMRAQQQSAFRSGLKALVNKDGDYDLPAPNKQKAP